MPLTWEGAPRQGSKLAAPFSCLVPQQDVVGVRDPVHEALAEAQRVYGREARVVDAQANERQPCRAAAVAGGGAEGLGRGVGRGREVLALGFADHALHDIRQQLLHLAVVPGLRSELLQGDLPAA